MVKKYDLEESRHQISYAWDGIPFCFNDTKRDFETAKNENTDAVKYVEEAIVQCKNGKHTELYSEWEDLLCEASFGKGLAEGLLEMKYKTYRNCYRSFQELESVVEELHNACADLATEPKSPENHLKVGKGLGRFGLAKEGKNILERGIYWDNINDYLSNK